MENAGLIFEYNTETAYIQMKHGVCSIKCHAQKLNDKSLSKILKELNGIRHKYPSINPLIELDLSKVIPADKLVYILLENICYFIIKEYKYLIRAKLIHYAVIQASGYKYSPLYLLTRQDKKASENCQEYILACENRLTVRKEHYRLIVSKDEREDSDIFCVLMTDIRAFLKHYYGNEKRIEAISEVVVELCSNDWEHSHSDCLIDLDVANDYMKRDKTDNNFYGCINIVVLNLSHKLIGKGIEEKVLGSNKELPERYQTVREAFNFHKQFFNENYSKETFFGIAAFQDKISGRPEFDWMGGTGLPRLVRSMEKGFEQLQCYCCSGNSFIIFHPLALEYSADGWIGFNETGEFKDKLPMKGIIGRNEFYLPGTAFNLAFIFKRENGVLS